MTLLCAASNRAAAQERGGQRLAIPFTQRGIVVGAFNLAPEVDVALTKVGTDVSFSTDIGARFGIIEDLEVRAVVIPITYNPTFRYGTFDHPGFSFGGTYRFLKGDFELGGSADFTIGTIPGEKFRMGLGLPARLHIGKSAAFDTGAFFDLDVFGQTVSSPIGDIGGTKTTPGLHVPLRFSVDVVEPVHLGVNSAFIIGDLGDAGHTIAFPFGFFGGYAVGGDKGPVVDIDPFFQFLSFFTPGAPEGGNTFNSKPYQFGVNVTGYLYL